jgi:hypothetical protein
VGSLIGVLAGVVLGACTLVLGSGTDALILRGPDVVGIRPGLGTLAVALGVLTALVLLAAAVAMLAAWIGALVRTANRQETAWLVVLLVTGLLGFGVIGMAIYLLAGPPELVAPPTPTDLAEARS